MASVVEHEGDEQVDLVGHDPAVLDVDALLLDPGATDVAQGLVGALDAGAHRVLEALVGTGADLGDAGDGCHDGSSCRFGVWTSTVPRIALHPPRCKAPGRGRARVSP